MSLLQTLVCSADLRLPQLMNIAFAAKRKLEAGRVHLSSRNPFHIHARQLKGNLASLPRCEQQFQA